MKKVLVVCVICTIILVGCALLVARASHSRLSIKMSTISWLTPISHLEIDGDDVSYEEWSDGIKETRTAKISPLGRAELVIAIQWANVWAMEEGYREFCSGCPTTDLTITLDGRTKHISHYGWYCSGPPAQDAPYPPRALCALESTIRAMIGKPALGIHPTAAPSLTPTPTSTPPAIMRVGDFGILSHDPCGPPCFRGIRPGLTTFGEAASILKSGGFPCKASDSPSLGKFLYCNSGTISVMVGTDGLCGAGSNGPMVRVIVLAPPVKITLGEFIDRYGPPDSLLNTGGVAQLSYGSLQTFVRIPTGLQTASLTASAPIEQFIYVPATEYSKCLQMQEQDWQPWKGYGTYKIGSPSP